MTPGRLKNLRNQIGFTQEHAADLIGYSRVYYSQIECGSVTMPDGFYQRTCRKWSTRLKELADLLDYEASL